MWAVSFISYLRWIMKQGSHSQSLDLQCKGKIITEVTCLHSWMISCVLLIYLLSKGMKLHEEHWPCLYPAAIEWWKFVYWLIRFTVAPWCKGLRVPTHRAGVVSSIPLCVTITAPLVRKATSGKQPQLRTITYNYTHSYVEMPQVWNHRSTKYHELWRLLSQYFCRIYAGKDNYVGQEVKGL